VVLKKGVIGGGVLKIILKPFNGIFKSTEAKEWLSCRFYLALNHIEIAELMWLSVLRRAGNPHPLFAFATLPEGGYPISPDKR